MKKISLKIISLLLCLIMLLFFCGCDFNNLVNDTKEVLNNWNLQLNEIFNPEEFVIVEEEQEFTINFNSCYNELNSKQQKIYRMLYSAAKQMPSGFFKLCENYKNSNKDISVAYQAMLNDHVEIFWMPSTYVLGYLSNSGREYVLIAFDYDGPKNSAHYSVNKKQRDNMVEQLQTAVESILSVANSFDDDYEKELYFNDFICNNTEYTLEGDLVNTAYGCLVSKKALCEGYSRAFKLLCNEAEIECELISGIADGEGHMWNMINIYGEYSYVDVTWNDNVDGFEYAYFNISEQQLLFDHSLAPVFTQLKDSDFVNGTSFNILKKDCAESQYNYFLWNSLILNVGDAHKAVSAIKQTIESNNNKISFLIVDEDFKNQLKNDASQEIDNINLRLGLTFSKTIINSFAFYRDILVLNLGVSD